MKISNIVLSILKAQLLVLVLRTEFCKSMLYLIEIKKSFHFLINLLNYFIFESMLKLFD